MANARADGIHHGCRKRWHNAGRLRAKIPRPSFIMAPPQRAGAGKAFLPMLRRKCGIGREARRVPRDDGFPAVEGDDGRQAI